MAFCKNCGTKLEDGTKFCPNCGTPTDSNGVEQATRKQEFVGTIRKCPSCGAEVPAFAVQCPTCGHVLNESKIDKSVQEFFDKLESFTDEYETEEEKMRKRIIGGFPKYMLFFIAFFCFFAGFFPDDSVKVSPVILIFLGILLVVFGILVRAPLSQQELKKRNLIETFVVPNNKETVIEFLMLSCSQIQPGGNPFTKEGKRVSLWNKIWKTKIKQTITKANILFVSDKDGQEKVSAIRAQYKI